MNFFKSASLEKGKDTNKFLFVADVLSIHAPCLSPTTLLPFYPLPSSSSVGPEERESLMMLKVAVTALLQCQTSTCRQDCITAKIPAAGKLVSPGRGQDICSSQTKHMIQFVRVAGHTKATASKGMTLKGYHTYNFLKHLSLTMTTMLLRFLSVG